MKILINSKAWIILSNNIPVLHLSKHQDQIIQFLPVEILITYVVSSAGCHYIANLNLQKVAELKKKKSCDFTWQ